MGKLSPLHIHFDIHFDRCTIIFRVTSVYQCSLLFICSLITALFSFLSPILPHLSTALARPSIYRLQHTFIYKNARTQPFFSSVLCELLNFNTIAR